MKSNKRKKTLTAYLFLTPALLLFLVFFVIPIVAIAVLSCTKYNLISPMKFVGFDNFLKLFTNDRRVLNIIFNTLKYVLIFVPGHLVFGFLIAVGINRKIPRTLKYAYRTISYFPVLVTTSAVSIAWIYLYDKEFGLFNYLLSQTGLGPISWLASSQWGYVSIAIFGIWKMVGQSALYFLIGLQSMPESLLEAAEIDGANSWQKMMRIVIPIISPTSFFVGITVLINTLQIFDAPYILTRGGPGDATRSLNLYIYEFAYERYELGYASTLAFVLFLLVLILTFAVFKLAGRKVYYEND